MSSRTLAAIVPLERQSLSDGVFRQLHAQIVGGELPPGESLPSERSLCEAFGVNRGAVREALRRLEQARLVTIRHGGTSRVLDFRASAGLEMLGHMLISAEGQFDPGVVRSVMEMRSAIAPDAARLAALRWRNGKSEPLEAVVARMAATRDLGELQVIALQYWSRVIDAADNIAYRLAYNSLRETYARCQSLLTQVLEPELRSFEGYQAVAVAIRERRPGEAEARARELIRLGEEGVLRALAMAEGMEREGRS